MLKNELRTLYKAKRKALDQGTINNYQQRIYEQVFSINYDTINSVHIFLPIKQQIEVDTYPIIRFFRRKKTNIIISKSNFKTASLQHYLFEEDTKLVTNSYGIPEPINAKPFLAHDIDLVFVPLLISDQQNYRVGYGKGFYDRFLNNCKPNIRTIGLNFFKPILKIQDINEFDIALQTIIYGE